MQVRQRLDALTSLRFFAAAMIVISHAHPIFGSLGIANAAPLGQGVSFFFVLSGFILAYNYPSLPDKAAIFHFWLARFARVWPLHAITCLLWIAVLFDFDHLLFFPGAWGMIKLVVNLALLQSWIPLKEWALSFNGVTWSLSVEFFFYLCFPFLISAWRRHWHWILAVQGLMIFSILLAGNIFALPGEDSYNGVGLLGLVYFNPAVRLFEFTIGIAVAYFVNKQYSGSGTLSLTTVQWFFLEIFALSSVIVSLLAAANFVGIGQTFGKSFAYYFTREGLWVFWAFLIGIFALSHGPITNILSTKIPVFLGEISFSLYLCHALFIHYLMPHADQIAPFGLVAALTFWLVILVFSALLFSGVEQPARRLILSLVANRTSGAKNLWLLFVPTLRTAAAVALITIFTVCLSIFRPSTIHLLDDNEVKAFLLSPKSVLIANGATFDGRYTILGIEIVTDSSHSVEHVLLRIMIRSDQKLVPSDVLAVHLNDENQKIIDKPGDIVLDKANHALQKNTYWIQEYTANRVQFDQASSIGLAMYKDPSVLFTVTAKSTDWGGKRLLIKK